MDCALQMDNLLTFSVPFLKFPFFTSNTGGNRWIIDETVDLWNIPDISRESPQAKLTHTKDELFNPSQAKLEQQV